MYVKLSYHGLIKSFGFLPLFFCKAVIYNLFFPLLVKFYYVLPVTATFFSPFKVLVFISYFIRKPRMVLSI